MVHKLKTPEEIEQEKNIYILKALQKDFASVLKIEEAFDIAFQTRSFGFEKEAEEMFTTLKQECTELHLMDYWGERMFEDTYEEEVVS